MPFVGDRLIALLTDQLAKATTRALTYKIAQALLAFHDENGRLPRFVSVVMKVRNGTFALEAVVSVSDTADDAPPGAAIHRLPADIELAQLREIVAQGPPGRV